MSKFRPLLWLVISAAFAVLGNLVASGLEQKYGLVTNQTRWIVVVGTFLISFAALAWLECHRARESQDRASINSLFTGPKTKTGEIKMRAKGGPPGADVNIVELGPRTETADIEMESEDSDAD